MISLGCTVRSASLRLFSLSISCLALLHSPMLMAQESSPSADTLKQMSLEALMEIEVTSVSRYSEKLRKAASAIQVITQEVIRRSGVTSLPQALRLASNLQVAQVNAHDWAITARGFNGAPLTNSSLANKLLVMIDGRSVYTPLFGGVFWDVQNVLLEDIDRIEVISGPGGTLWGSNAVNGVINIITKHTRDTQGIFVSGAGGSFLRDLVSARYGRKTASGASYRIYGQRLDQNNTFLQDGESARDEWGITQAGFRWDQDLSEASSLTFQGDLYSGNENSPGVTEMNGQNVLGRWNHMFTNKSDIKLQIYFDRTRRKTPGQGFVDTLKTYDVDFHHRFAIGTHHSFLWGAGYRLMDNDVTNTLSFSLIPPSLRMNLFSFWVQDQIAVVPDSLKLTLGTKLEHNHYSDYDLQPNVRLAYTPDARNTLWGAISRAVHSPSRLDVDTVTPGFLGGRDFGSEKVTSYEIGYHCLPVERLSVSLAGFYNVYKDLRSINLQPAPLPQLIFANDQEAETWGVEISWDLQATDRWRLHGGYTYLDTEIRSITPAVIPGSDRFEAIDPSHQFLFQSILDLPGNFHFDATGRYVDSLPASAGLSPRVPAYFTFDIRLAWQSKNWEFSLNGQNLAEERHQEFGAKEIPRAVYGNVAWRY